MKMGEEANQPLDFAKFVELMMLVEVLYWSSAIGISYIANIFMYIPRITYQETHHSSYSTLQGDILRKIHLLLPTTIVPKNAYLDMATNHNPPKYKHHLRPPHDP